jgi:hypothetical protein
MIHFNWDAKAGEPGRSDFGKLIPLQVAEDGELLNERHNCPKSTWNKPAEQQLSSVGMSDEIVNNVLSKLEKINLDVAALLTMISQSTESELERLDQIIAHLKEEAKQ